MTMQNYLSAKILIVDDEHANVRLLERLLKKNGYEAIRSTTDSREAIPLYLEFQPDLLLLDLMMPHHDGYQVMKQLNLLNIWDVFPYIGVNRRCYRTDKRKGVGRWRQRLPDEAVRSYRGFAPDS